MILKIGCATGETTVFLNKHLDFCKVDKEYIDVDTFFGFTHDDINYERNKRNKKSKYTGFSANKKEWFDIVMKKNCIKRVKSIRADVNTFNFKMLKKKISLCIIDVDLYNPVKASLNSIYDLMNTGGDNCCR